MLPHRAHFKKYSRQKLRVRGKLLRNHQKVTIQRVQDTNIIKPPQVQSWKLFPPCYPSQSFSNASDSASKLKWMQNSAPGVRLFQQHQAPTPCPQLRLCHPLGHNLAQDLDRKFSYEAILHVSVVNVLLVLQAFCQRQGD